MSSHFNAGNVWGRITKADEKTTKEKHTPYLEMQIDCSNKEYGTVKAFGRMWGKDKVSAFLAHHATHPGDMIRLKGYYGQYEDEGGRYSGYTFYDFQPAKPEEVSRAAFILVGDLAKKELREGDPVLTMEVIRPGKDMDREETLEVFLFDLMTYYEIEEGDLIEVRGILRKREAEDLYGGSTNDPFRPYVMVTKKRTRK